MLPTYQSSPLAADTLLSSFGQSLLNSRRSEPWNTKRRTKLIRFAPLSTLIFLIGILVLGYQVWYASAHISSPLESSKAVEFGQLPPQKHLSRKSLGRQQQAQRAQRQRHFPVPHLTHLVLVACHSVYTGLDFHNSEEQSSWFLLDYQKVPGQTHSFVEHIQLGVQQAASDPNALLLFSGGKTRREAGPRAEGEGYWLVAEAAQWYGQAGVRERTFTEDHARDSFENLLFGLCRFYELTGHYPSRITVVGYEFKRERFMQVHRGAIAFPLDHFNYLGTPALNEGALKGEAQTVAAFRGDPYGCSGELAAKRAQRDPFSHGGPTPGRCPAIGALLDHCGPELYRGELPWREEEEGGLGGVGDEYDEDGEDSEGGEVDDRGM